MALVLGDEQRLDVAAGGDVCDIDQLFQRDILDRPP